MYMHVLTLSFVLRAFVQDQRSQAAATAAGAAVPVRSRTITVQDAADYNFLMPTIGQ
jgi:hypothetical protein